MALQTYLVSYEVLCRILAYGRSGCDKAVQTQAAQMRLNRPPIPPPQTASRGQDVIMAITPEWNLKSFRDRVSQSCGCSIFLPQFLKYVESNHIIVCVFLN